jgi:hypothetical protein
MSIRNGLLSVFITCSVTYGQQALFVSPGGLVVFNENSISTTEGKLSKDESTLDYKGKTYPNSGPLFEEMLKQNPIKYDALIHIKVNNGIIIFDGKFMDIGVPVTRIEVALRWGDLIACIGVIPHASTRWLEPNNTKALIVFSPTTAKGVYKGLYLGEKVSCRIWLLDPINKDDHSIKRQLHKHN